MSAHKRNNDSKIIAALGGLFILLFGLSMYIFPQVRQFLSDQIGFTQEVKGSTCHMSGDIILLTDTSDSMNGQPLQKAVEAAKNFVDIVASYNTSSPSDRIGLVTFDTDARVNNPLTTNYTQVKNSLDALGNTPRNTCTQCGIDTAAQEIKTNGTHSTKVAILLTDGRANFIEGWPPNHAEDQQQGEDAANTAANAAHANLGMIFYTIGLGNQVNQDFLRGIANNTGGDYYFSPGLGQLQSIYQDIAQTCPPSISPTPSGSPNPTSPATGQYSISGNIYVDYVNQNSFIKPPDTLYKDGPSTIDVYDKSGKNLITETTTQTGQYNTAPLNPGTYLIEYTSLPANSGYFMTYPTTGPPPSFKVTIGNNCDPGNENDGYCSKGSAKGVNFGITNIKPWYQSTCGDLRIDGSMKNAGAVSNGVTDPIPVNPVCGNTAVPAPYVITCQNSSGIVFSGNNSYDFGRGSASRQNYVGGGAGFYPETFTPVPKGVIRTSYEYMMTTAKQSGLLPIELDDNTSSKICDLSQCHLPPNLPHGLYHAEGNLYLHTFTVPANTTYVILVHGDLHILGSITMPANKKSSLTISASGNIYIDPSVGVNDPTDTSASIAGFYSTDQSFIVQSNGLSCANGNNDKRLNVDGAVIVNAGEQTPPGIFENDRNLCIDNFNCPVVSFTERPDLLLNTPSFIKDTSSLFQELAP